MKKEILIMTLDTETYNGLLGKLKKLAIYYGENVVYADSYSEIESHIKQLAKFYRIHCYIHNSEFDLRKLPELYDGNRIDWKNSMCIGGKIATLKLKYMTIHDSFKILPSSLKKLSKDFNVEHGKLDLWEEVKRTYPNQYEIYDESGTILENESMVNFLDKCPINDEVFLKYLGYDVISLYEIIGKLIEISGLEVEEFVKRISTSSLSRYIFKNGYKGKMFRVGLKKAYAVMTKYKWFEDLESEEVLRNAYCGGRTEVLKPLLTIRGYHYDINSLYPYVMSKYLFPVGKPHKLDDGETVKNYFNNWLENHEGGGVVQCTVRVPKQHIPPLPVKMGKLAFPCGIIKGTWTYMELESAIKECGCEILEYDLGLHFFEMQPIFRDFIDTMYTLKEQASIDGNESLRTFAKLLQNCGYGYTGMRRDDKTSFLPIDKWEEHIHDAVTVNEKLGYIEIPTEVKADYIQVQVASYVTSYARLELLKALRMADTRGQVFYCDTDSIVTDTPLPDEIVHNTRLGAFKLESQPLKAIFLKPKVYAEIIENKEGVKETFVKFKGVSKDTQRQLGFSEYEELVKYMSDINVESVRVEKDKLMTPSLMVLQKKHLDLNYHEYRDKRFFLHNVEKRTVDYEKNETYPLYFETFNDFANFRFNKASRGVDLDLWTKEEL